MNFTEAAQDALFGVLTDPFERSIIVSRIVRELQSAYESGKAEERERAAKLCEDTAMHTGGMKPTYDIYVARPSTHIEDLSHHAGMGYAALIREAKL